MKTATKVILITFAAILLLGIKGAKAGDEFRKVIKKEFQVDPNAQVTINNKFGKIHFSNWEKNEVEIEVTPSRWLPPMSRQLKKGLNG
jgi:hypothetical protein